MEEKQLQIFLKNVEGGLLNAINQTGKVVLAEQQKISKKQADDLRKRAKQGEELDRTQIAFLEKADERDKKAEELRAERRIKNEKVISDFQYREIKRRQDAGEKLSQDDLARLKKKDLRDKEREIEEKKGREVFASVTKPIQKLKDNFGALFTVLGLFIKLKFFKFFLSTGMGGKWLESILGIINFFGDLTKIWGDEKKPLEDKLKETIPLLGELFKNVFIALMPFMALALVKFLAGKVLTFFFIGLGKLALSGFITTLKTAGKTIASVFTKESVVKGFDLIRSKSKDYFKRIGDGFKNLKADPKGFFSGIGTKTKDFFARINPFGKGGFLSKIGDFFKGSGKSGGMMKFFRSPAFKIFKNVASKGLKAVPYLGQVIMAIEGIMGGFSAGMEKYEEGGSIGDIIVATFGGIVDGVFGWIVDIGAWLAGVFGFEEVEKKLDEFSFADLYSGMWQAVKNWFSGADSDAPEESWWSLLWGKITSLFAKIGDKIREFEFGDLVDIFSGAGEIKGIANSLADTILNDKGSSEASRKTATAKKQQVASMHQGGFVQDVPAILQSGEYVVSRQNVQAAMANGGRVSALDRTGSNGAMGSAPIINNIVNNNSSSNVSNMSNTVARPFSELYTAFTG